MGAKDFAARGRGETYALGVKPHPKFRKVAKWTGAILTVGFLGLSIVSARWGFGWKRAGHSWIVMDSERVEVLYIGARSPSRRPGSWSYFDATLDQIRWDFDAQFTQGNFRIAVPGWFLVAMSASVWAIAWRQDRRAYRLALHGKCQHCTFDLAGLPPDSKCPECGKAKTI